MGTSSKEGWDPRLEPNPAVLQLGTGPHPSAAGPAGALGKAKRRNFCARKGRTPVPGGQCCPWCGGKALTEEMLVWFAIISPLTRCAEGR